MNNNIGFVLLKVTTEQFAIIENSFDDREKTHLNLNISFTADEENEQVACFLEIKYVQNETPFLVLETGCHFKIESEAWEVFFDKNDNTLRLPRSFAAHLLMLNIGTARGILHSKTETTSFNKFLLPTINVNKLIIEDIKMDLLSEQ